MAYSSGTPNEYFPSGSGNITSALRLVYDRRVPATDDAGLRHCRTWELVAENNHGQRFPAWPPLFSPSN
jgi:hypothetical protein